MEWNGLYREVSGHLPDATNNRAELTAVIEGLRALKQPCIVVVHSDSEYVQRPYTDGYIKRWRDSGWARPKMNADLWKVLDREVNRHLVSWEWVRGHDGNPLNERCDVLAGNARRVSKGFDSGVKRHGQEEAIPDAAVVPA